VVILEFEAAVEEGNDRHFRKVSSSEMGFKLIEGLTIAAEMSTFRNQIPNNPAELGTKYDLGRG
jgi:hypothetical protein